MFNSDDKSAKVRSFPANPALRVYPDFATSAGDRHMDKVKEQTPNERGDELRLAAIHGDVHGDRYVSFSQSLSLVSPVHFDSF
ncbi:hypothetical protein Y032_0084g1790 [Ancylostoma ceylanicum]|uniref:Uncharacterized protein n=1 Tax=Ancylostoma ceylanicum TaxID=53326 RepID=A0A016TQU6_9BILA|nr:hypothetical protein Y032_0084g1790 [Ancylostoma ceylanicum]